MKTPALCRDCNDLTRRDFVRAAAALSAVGLVGAQDARKTSETRVTDLYKSLTDVQRKEICKPFDDPLRLKVDNNWHINKLRVGKDYTSDQQALIKDIFTGLHSSEYAPIVQGQVDHDNGCKELAGCAVAIFGEPGTGKFEFVFTGRHVTRRCDGDSVDGAAFGGPIFYGHAAESFNEKPDHKGNIYWFQAKRANELFAALDGKQREKALLGESRGEHGTKTVALPGKAELPGLPASALSADQKKLAQTVLKDMLAPFREADQAETMKIVEIAGVDALHFSYYKNEDIGDDGVWDVWQVEGPNMVWYFRGKPHVHTWVNVARA